MGASFNGPTRGTAVSLRNAKVEPAVPVSDIARAREFYETTLGLGEGRAIFDGGITYACGEGREIHIYPSPANAGSLGGTIAAWEVVDLERTVDELTANGVVFDQYDNERFRTNEKGIAELGDERVAWFKDPDGNAYGIVQL
jgi:catechol 2,3-dioxygenase-like lactoylglutathione lyase family enzyme